MFHIRSSVLSWPVLHQHRYTMNIDPNVSELLDIVLPLNAEPVQRRRFQSLVGLKPEIVVKVWVEYRESLHRWRVSEKDIMWALSMAKSPASLEVLAHLWRTTKSTFHRRALNAVECLYYTLDEVCQFKYV